MTDFSGAYPRYHRLAIRVIERFVQHPEICEELAQETFLKVHRSLASFDPNRRLSTWVGQIAKNTAIDYLRAMRAVELEPYEDELECSRPDPESQAMRGEEIRVIAEIIRPLPRSQQRVLWGMYVQGLSQAEIAETPGVSPAAVKNLHYRAMITLRGI